MSIDRAWLLRVATSGRLEQAVRRVGPLERLARRAASPYVAGPHHADAVQLARRLCQQGSGASIDEFGGEDADAPTAQRVADDYQRMAGELASLPDDIWLSVDLSRLGLAGDRSRCAEHLRYIARRMPPGRRIQVGAEGDDRAQDILGCVLSVARDGLADRLGATVPANVRRSPADLEQLVQAGVHIRLVKGAYPGPPARVLSPGEPTDIAFIRLACRLAETQANFALATHDGLVREALLLLLGPRPVEQLLGVRPDALGPLVARGVPTRVYVPFGQHWFRYWMRLLVQPRGG